MAKNYRWFKISEANAEIERLETELAAAKASAASASSENEAVIAEEATKLKSEVDKLSGQVSALTSQVSQLSTDKAKLENDLAAAQTAVTEFEAKVEARAAEKAAAITASLGVPPAPSNPAGGQRLNFAARLDALIKEGKAKTKAEAINFCIRAFPAEYAEWRAGDTSKI